MNQVLVDDVTLLQRYLPHGHSGSAWRNSGSSWRNRSNQKVGIETTW